MLKRSFNSEISNTPWSNARRKMHRFLSEYEFGMEINHRIVARKIFKDGSIARTQVYLTSDFAKAPSHLLNSRDLHLPHKNLTFKFRSLQTVEIMRNYTYPHPNPVLALHSTNWKLGTQPKAKKKWLIYPLLLIVNTTDKIYLPNCC